MKLGRVVMLIGGLSVVNATAATQKSGSSDSAYTGTSGSTSGTPKSTKTKHKAKAKAKAKSPVFWANDPEKPDAKSSAVSTKVAAEEHAPASTNVVVEPISPTSTNSVFKPEQPASTNIVETPTPPDSTNIISKPEPPSGTNTVASVTPPAATSDRIATLSTADLKEFSDQPPRIQALTQHGLDLTTQGLKYQYGSCDPKNGGMDCSGTVYYLLAQAGLKDVPRDASEIYSWVWKKGEVQPVTSSNLSTFELSRLKPGDLLFWSGTYDVDRDPPITHVMIYLGTNKQTGRRVMVGASEGRTYEGKSRYGVSVFDFVLPKAKSEGSGRFIGYGPIPGL